jgi:hypothetical protein
MSLLLLIVIVTGGVIYAYQSMSLRLPPLRFDRQEFGYPGEYPPINQGEQITLYQHAAAVPPFYD